MANDPQYIVIVEDSPTQAVQMQLLLEEAGYRVSAATDGRSGLDLVEAESPDLVVTDLIMPELNGLELVETVKSQLPNLPVILTTAQGSEDTAAEALRRGAASYVPKKSIALDLVPTVSRLLALNEAQRVESAVAEFLTDVEKRFCLRNDDVLVPQLVRHLKEQVQQMAICGERELLQLATALDEALVNAMIHGNLEVSSKLREVDNGREYRRLAAQRRKQSPFSQRSVYVDVRVNRNLAEFVIRDEGPGFDPKSIPDPTDPANIQKVSGRGLMLINTFMDQVSHNHKGNEITMVKRATGV